MNRNVCLYAIFFSCLTLFCGLLQGIISLLLGSQMYTLDSFGSWFLVSNLIYLVASLFILKYYHDKKYRAAFATATIHIIAGLFLCIVFYTMFTGKAANSLYLPGVYLSLTATLFYGTSLIFSKARERAWLKTAGISILVFSIIHLTITTWYLNTQDDLLKGSIDKIQPWLSLVGSLIPVLFVMNFINEIRNLNNENDSTQSQKTEHPMLGLLSAIAISLILLFGVMFADQGSSKVYWANRNFEKTREMAERFEPGTFISSKGEKLRYRLLKPVNYDPHKKYPLVVCLPYGGQPATDTIRQIEGAAAAEILSSEVNRLKYPAFLFVPNVPAGAGWGGIANYPTVDTLVLETIVAVEQAEAGIDVKRCYITGISRGGYGAWHFITIRPDLFAAAIPVCGGGNPQLGKNVVDVSVWAFHGEKDQNVPVNGSRDMIAAIKKAGGHPLYTEYKGEGHNIWDKVSGTQGLWDWLFAQQRN